MITRDYVTIVEIPDTVYDLGRGPAGQMGGTVWLERCTELSYEPVIDDDGILHLKMNMVTGDDRIHRLHVSGTVRDLLAEAATGD